MGAAFLTSNTRLCRIGELPIQPAGSRILILPHRPQETSEAGIIIPETAQHKPYSGKIIAAGLKARDVMRDHDIRIGDSVWYAKFGGVLEEYDHVTSGEFTCPHGGEHSWGRRPKPDPLASAYQCELCGATRIVEPITLADVDDILGCVEQAEAMHAGDTDIVTKNTDNGIQHFYERKAS